MSDHVDADGGMILPDDVARAVEARYQAKGGFFVLGTLTFEESEGLTKVAAKYTKLTGTPLVQAGPGSFVIAEPAE